MTTDHIIDCINHAAYEMRQTEQHDVAQGLESARQRLLSHSHCPSIEEVGDDDWVLLRISMWGQWTHITAKRLRARWESGWRWIWAPEGWNS